MKNFKWLLLDAGFVWTECKNVKRIGKLKRKEASEYLSFSEKTLERWIQNDNPCPRAVKLLEIRGKGKIAHERWKNFFIDKEGKLWTPQGFSYEPEFINKINIMQTNARFQQSMIQGLSDQIENFKEIANMKNEINQIAKRLTEITEEGEAELIDFPMAIKAI